jgi:molecular chaperone GrpE
MNPSPGTSGGPRFGRSSGTEDVPEEEQTSGAGSDQQPDESHSNIGQTRGGASAGTSAEGTDASARTVEVDLNAALEASRNERDEYLEMLRRVQADFENYKKRMLRQQTEHLERAGEGLVVRLLPALDAFNLAREHLGEGDDLSTEGKALVQASALLFDTLAKEGLERTDDLGQPFDPNRHEAVEHEPSPDDAGNSSEADGGTTEGADVPVVSGVLRAGYRWKGKVIRPAMVRVRG